MRYNNRIAIVSLTGHLLFLFAFILLHFLRPDKSAMSNFTSEFAIGDFGWMMTLGFLGITIGAFFLATGLLIHFKASKTTTIALGLWFLGMLVVALFKTDIPGEKVTATGLIHGFAALIAFISLGIAMIAWGSVFRKNNWNSMGQLSRIFGVISLILFIIFFMSPPSFRGLTQRILIIWDMLWLLLVNYALLRNTKLSTISILKN